MGAFGERLHDAMVIAGLSVEWVADRRKVRIETVLLWLASATAACMDGDTLALLGMDLGVSIRWLALGFGSPVPIGMKKAREQLAEKVMRRAPRKRQGAIGRG